MLSGGVRIWLAFEPVDMRLSFDGLAGRVQHALGRDSYSGECFVFRGKSAEKLKMLLWDGLGLLIRGHIQHYQELAHLVRTRPLTVRVSHDRDDDHVIACALAAKASLIVFGDGDLRDLGTYKGIRILHATDALRLIAQ